jgi:hypothetical protein
MNITTIYPFVLFIHILGAFGLVAALTTEAIGLRGLRRATTRAEALTWFGISRGLVMRLAPASLGLILITGLFMMAVSWGGRGWLIVALASLIALGVIGAFATGMPMASLEPALRQATGGLAPDLQARLRARGLLVSLSVRMAIVLGILFLMTVKPSAPAAVITILVAVGAGLLAGQVFSSRNQGELRSAAG